MKERKKNRGPLAKPADFVPIFREIGQAKEGYYFHLALLSIYNFNRAGESSPDESQYPAMNN